MPEGHSLKMSYKWNLPIQDGRYLVNGERVSFAVSMDDQNDLFRCSATEEGLVSEESDTFTISVECRLTIIPLACREREREKCFI